MDEKLPPIEEDLVILGLTLIAELLGVELEELDPKTGLIPLDEIDELEVEGLEKDEEGELRLEEKLLELLLEENELPELRLEENDEAASAVLTNATDKAMDNSNLFIVISDENEGLRTRAPLR